MTLVGACSIWAGILHRFSPYSARAAAHICRRTVIRPLLDDIPAAGGPRKRDRLCGHGDRIILAEIRPFKCRLHGKEFSMSITVGTQTGTDQGICHEGRATPVHRKSRWRSLSERIGNLTEHFKTHAKDNHSRRGLLKLVSQRRRLLDYVKSRKPGALSRRSSNGSDYAVNASFDAVAPKGIPRLFSGKVRP